MLQVYSKAISPGQDSGDKTNQPSRPDDVGAKTPQREELNLHPIRMRDILQTVLQDERTGIKYGKYLDWQAR